MLTNSPIGIPDLLVVPYDVDPSTKPEEFLDNFAAGHVVSRSDRFLPHVIERDLCAVTQRSMPVSVQNVKCSEGSSSRGLMRAGDS
jgi:hypothetical protein